MSESVSKIFDFACANPDYWALMREEREPPEVVELETRRREAFNAARIEVQRLYSALLDEVHENLKARSVGTAMETVFAKSFHRPSYQNATFYFRVLSGKGKLTDASISIAEGTSGRISLYCGLGGPAARMTKIQDSFRANGMGDRLQVEGGWAYIEEPIPLGDSLSDIAARLVDAFWPSVLAYSKTLGNAPESAVAEGEVDDE